MGTIYPSRLLAENARRKINKDIEEQAEEYRNSFMNSTDYEHQFECETLMNINLERDRITYPVFHIIVTQEETFILKECKREYLMIWNKI